MTRTMKGKLIAILMSLAVGFAVMLVIGQSAYANNIVTYDLVVGGVQVTSENCGDILGDGKVKFTPGSKDESAELTLNNAEIKVADLESTFAMVYDSAAGIYVGDGKPPRQGKYVEKLYIKLIGENRITLPDTKLNKKIIGILGYGNINNDSTISIITDNNTGGSLNIELSDTTCKKISGIDYTDVKDARVSTDLSINIKTGTESGDKAYGINTNKNLTLSGKGVKMNIASPDATGIYHEDRMTLYSSLVIDLNKGRTGDTDYNTGIQSAEKETSRLTIDGGTVIIKSGEGFCNYGISDSTVFLGKGTMIVKMGPAKNMSYGLYDLKDAPNYGLNMAYDDPNVEDDDFLSNGGYVEISGHTAAIDNNSKIDHNLYKRGVLVNTEPKEEGADTWDNTTEISNYKYFRIPEKTFKLNIHWSSLDGVNIDGQEPVVIEDIPAGMSIGMAYEKEEMDFEQGVFKKDGYVTNGSVLYSPITKYNSWTDLFKNNGVSFYDKVSANTDIYSIMLKEVRNASVTVKPPVCGVETKTDKDKYGDWDYITQTNPPEYSFPAGADYGEFVPSDLTGSPKSFWSKRENNKISPFIGKFEGGKKYDFLVTMMPKYGYGFIEKPSVSVNGNKPKDAAVESNLILMAFSDIYADHDWDEGKVTKNATTTDTGIKTFTCRNCKATKTETIQKITPEPKPTPKPDPTPAPTPNPNPKPTPKPDDKEHKSKKSRPKTDLSKGADAAAADKVITGIKNDKDPAGSEFAPLILKSAKQGKNNIKLTWTKNKDAVRYAVYGNICNAKGKKYKPVKIATVKGGSYKVKKIGKSKLKKGTYYKFIIVAIDKNNKVVSTSKMVHVATKGGKVGNHNSVTVKIKKGKKYKAVSKATIKKGKTLKLKVSLKPASKKLKVKKHAGVRYETSNAKIATVKGGKIKAKKKGKCNVYVYAQNGVYKAVKLTVK